MNENLCGMSNNYLDPSDEQTLSYVEAISAENDHLSGDIIIPLKTFKVR